MSSLPRREAIRRPVSTNKSGNGNETIRRVTAAMAGAEISGDFHTLLELARICCLEIDGQPYTRYNSLSCPWAIPVSNKFYLLILGRAQPDPFTQPTRAELRIPSNLINLPPFTYSTPTHCCATADFLLRRLRNAVSESFTNTGPSSQPCDGFTIYQPGPLILHRSAVQVALDGSVLCRFGVWLPAKGRLIDGQAAANQLAVRLPTLISSSLLDVESYQAAVIAYADSVVVQESLRNQLAANGLAAFVGNGSVLPRDTSGGSLPGAIPFVAPPQLLCQLEVPDTPYGRQRPPIQGLGIPRGLTVITGFSGSGKSALVDALAVGMYNKPQGDGREMVVVDPTAFAISADRGRSISGVNVEMIAPGAPSASNYTATSASAPLSVAASVSEALESGVRLFIVDENDVPPAILSADQGLEALGVSGENPLRPLCSLVEDLSSLGVSIILSTTNPTPFIRHQPHILVFDNHTLVPQPPVQKIPKPPESAQQEPYRRQLTRNSLQHVFDVPLGNARYFVRTGTVVELGSSVVSLTSLTHVLTENGQIDAIASAIETLAQQPHRITGLTVSSLASLICEAFMSTLDTIPLDDATLPLDVWTGTPKNGQLAGTRAIDIAAVINRLPGLTVNE